MSQGLTVVQGLSAQPPALSNSYLPGPRCATFGDSIVALAHQNFISIQSTAGGFVVANGIATITTTANHQLGVGDYVHIWNLLGSNTGTLYGNNTHSFQLDGAYVPVIATSSPTVFQVSAQGMPSGDYSAIGSPYFWRISQLKLGADQSWFRWMNAGLGGSMYISVMYAYGSSVSNDFIQVVQNQVPNGPRFDVALISTGTNDIFNAASPMAQAVIVLANIQAGIAILNALGVFVIIATPPPQASGNFQIAQALANVRYGLLQMAQSNPRMRVLDQFAEYADGTTQSGGFGAATDTVDSIHVSSQGLYKIFSRRTKDVPWQSLWLPPDIEPVTVSDDLFTLNTAGTAIPWPNFCPTFIGTGGAAGGATGTAPNNWSLVPSGGITASTITSTAAQALIAQPNTNQAKWGFGWGLSIPFTANNQVVTCQTPNLLVSYTGVPSMKGNYYRASFTVTASAAIAAGVLKSLTGILNIVGGNSAGLVTWFGGDQQAFLYSNGYPLANNDRLVISSDPIWIPNDAAITAFNMSLEITSGTVAGTAALQVSNPQLKQIALSFK